MPRTEFLNEQGLIFGQSYQSTTIIPDGTPALTVSDPVTQYLPSARPGSRASHVWLERGSERLSTIDLFGGQFVLLTGAKGADWINAAARLTRKARPELIAYMVGGNAVLGDPEDAWRLVYGLDPDGAVLVRPDGYVGWRSQGSVDDALRVLTQVLDRILKHGFQKSGGW